VRHGQQLQLAVVDAEDVVALKVQPVNVALDLLVVGRIAEPQVAVVLGSSAIRWMAQCGRGAGATARMGTMTMGLSVRCRQGSRGLPRIREAWGAKKSLAGVDRSLEQCSRINHEAI
jgi:hypothetical protein